MVNSGSSFYINALPDSINKSYFSMNTEMQFRIEYWYGVKEESLKYLTSQERSIFFAVFLLIFVVAFFANIYAIYVTITRKHRFIQKTCIISLSLTDILTATAYTINYLETFSHPLMNWTMGSFLCRFIPSLQIFGVIGSSAALVAIALDRYRNVVHALRKKCNPSPWICILGAMALWIVCAGAAYPLFTLFVLKRVFVAFFDKNGKPEHSEEMHLCFSDAKEELKIYFICISSLIFLPLLMVFLWLYFNVAKLIWTHRKPVVAKFQKKNENASMETSTSQIKSTEDTSKNVSTVDRPKFVLPRTRSIHVERKIRTFKIIISLMLIFIGCRLPYFIFTISKVTMVFTQHYYWIMIYVFNGLALLNCALNPFLYTFLNPTLTVLVKIHKTVVDFICNICCCCFSSTEFEEFEKENPFPVDTFNKKPITCKSSPHPDKKRNSRVKFEDCARVANYFKKDNELPETYRKNKKY